MTYPELLGYMKKSLEKGDYHASALMREVVGKGNPRFWEAKAFEESRLLTSRLKEEVCFYPGEVVRQMEEEGVRKFLTRLSDGAHIESVVIPMMGYATLCLSTQVGCRMGCRFCRTAEMGLERNLTPSEIVGQLWNARFTLGASIRNLVFMGMGEPLDNLDAVVRSIKVMTDIRGFSIGPRRITVSTVGLCDKMVALAEARLGVRLALSLNASEQKVRASLMPAGSANDLSRLKETLLHLKEHPGLRPGVMLEYVLLKGVNDSDGDVERLASFAQGLSATFNVIPWHASEGDASFCAPDDEAVNAFHEKMRAKGLSVRRRWSQGKGLLAACGQLGAEEKG